MIIGECHAFGHGGKLPDSGLSLPLALLDGTHWNAFGFDRSAVQAYFAWPVPISRALVGRTWRPLFLLLEVMMVTAACLLLRMQPSPHKIWKRTW
jgi:hypothetical protein